MRVLLTGGTGYLGGHVARALREAGHEVVALVRRPRADLFAGLDGVRVHPGDVARPDVWSGVLSEVEGVVHLAGRVESGGRDARLFDRVNVDGTLELAERARSAGVRRVVMTSSIFALGPSAPGTENDESAVDREAGRLASANQYVRSKTEGTRRLRDLQRAGHGLILLYPTVLLGPGRLSRGNHTARVLADIGRGRFPGLVGDGEQVWNLVPVADAARGHVLALEKGKEGEGYILGGENWTQRRLIERAAHYFGIAPPPVRRLGRALPLAVGLACEIWNRLTGRAPYLTRGEVLLYDANWAVSSAKAERDLGYAPASVEATLAATVAWLRHEVLRHRA